MTDGQLREFGKSAFKDFVSSRKVAQSLLVKRKAYKFENEVRLIHFDHTNQRGTSELYRYSFDPLAVVEQVMVDGRMPVEEFYALKEEVVKRTGLSSRRIKRSLLYSEAKDFVVYVP